MKNFSYKDALQLASHLLPSETIWENSGVREQAISELASDLFELADLIYQRYQSIPCEPDEK